MCLRTLYFGNGPVSDAQVHLHWLIAHDRFQGPILERRADQLWEMVGLRLDFPLVMIDS